MPLKHHSEHPTYKPNNLAATGFVYVRHDAHHGPHAASLYIYKGPFKILDTGEKHFTLDINGCPDTVSIDRLKTAYIDLHFVLSANRLLCLVHIELSAGDDSLNP